MLKTELKGLRSEKLHPNNTITDYKNDQKMQVRSNRTCRDEVIVFLDPDKFKKEGK